MPTIGRGGAGNIQLVADANNRISADLEAQQSAADTYTNPAAELPPAAREEQLYAHSGRGGSGNYYSPRELRETAQFHGAERSHILGDGTPAPSSAGEQARAPMRTYGRGGAGNYAFGVTESEERAAKRKEEEDAAKRERLKEEVEKGVKESLAMPAKAKLAGGEPS